MIEITNINNLTIALILICFLGNTGNVGRTLLRNAEKLAPIVFKQDKLPQEIGEAIIKALATFWIAIQCGYVIDPEKLDAYAIHVDNLLRTYLQWHPGVPSM